MLLQLLRVRLGEWVKDYSRMCQVSKEKSLQVTQTVTRIAERPNISLGLNKGEGMPNSNDPNSGESRSRVRYDNARRRWWGFV
jgi:hypothetical protein